jgi:hypothetical protein
MIRAFETSFVTQYQPAFTELVRLGSVAAQKKVEGKDTLKEDEIAQRLFIVLQALDSDGLTTKQVEALEYCLLRLNESLSGPTVEALVNVTPTINLVDRIMRAWMGSYTMTMQEVVMTLTRRLTAEPGAFLLSGQSVGFTYNRYLALSLGAFTYSGVPATFTYTEIDPYEYGLLLNEGVAGSPSWRAIFDHVTGTRQLDVTGNGDSDSGPQKSTNNVTVTVWKTSNSGITEDAGDVVFQLNSSPVDTQTFLAANNLNGSGANYKQYVFTGLSPGDQLDVIITEG